MKNLAAPLLAFALLASPIAYATRTQAQSAATSVPKVTLTATQKTKIDQLRKDTRSQIQRLFSRKQIETYNSLRQRNVPAAQAMEMIDLNRSRRDQLRRILVKSRDQFVKILGQT